MQALGLIETKGLVAAVVSADAMIKAADVNLLEKTYVGGGLVLIAVTGDVGAVKAAVEAGEAAVRKIDSTLLVSQHVIPHPHEDLENVIIAVAPLKNEEMLTVVSAKTESEEEVEMIEEDTTEVLAVVEKIVVEALVIEDSVGKEFFTEKTLAPLQKRLGDIPNKEAIDKMVLEYSLEEAIEILNKFKVIELRNLAREYNNFGIAGRSVSKANKKLLLTKFREYYGDN